MKIGADAIMSDYPDMLYRIREEASELFLNMQPEANESDAV